jgi:hypothetical protein
MGWESREWVVGKDMWTRIGHVISLAQWESSDTSDVRLLTLVYRKTVMRPAGHLEGGRKLGAAQAPWDVGPANLSLLSFTTTHPPLFTPPAFFHPRTMDGCQSARRRPAAPSRSARGATGRGACRRSQGAPPRAPRARCFPTRLPSFFLPAYPCSPSPREPPRSVGRHVAAHPARAAAPCGRREVILCGWASCAPRPAGWSSPTRGRTLG